MQHSLTQYEIIPNRIILRNNNYIHRKTVINQKFQWLNKYISASSPRIFNPNNFVANHAFNRVNKQTKRYRSFVSCENGGRLKTSHDSTYIQQNVLGQRNMNSTQLRKTASTSQANINYTNVKPSKKQQSSISRFFRSKKTKSQFSVSKKSESHLSNHRRYRGIDCSQIKPWNIEIKDEDDDENICFKENIQHGLK